MTLRSATGTSPPRSSMAAHACRRKSAHAERLEVVHALPRLKTPSWTKPESVQKDGSRQRKPQGLQEGPQLAGVYVVDARGKTTGDNGDGSGRVGSESDNRLAHAVRGKREMRI